MVKNLFQLGSPFLLFACFSLYAQNLLLNPSFENDSLGWQMTTSGGRSIVTTQAQSGTHSEQMVLPGVAFPRAVWQTVSDSIMPGAAYIVSGWIKTDAVITSTAQIMVLWFNSKNPTNSQVPTNYLSIDTVGKLSGTHDWTSLVDTLIAPASAMTAQVYLECTATGGSSGTAWFDNLSFQMVPPVPPKLVSAVASDNNIEGLGIDNDDYVLLSFDKAVNNVTVTALNIDSIFPLSNGHSWLDGFGALGSAVWNPAFTKLLVNLSTMVSDPSIRVGDSITFTRGAGKVELTGTFDPPVAVRQHAAALSGRFHVTVTPHSVVFSCPQQGTLRIIDVKGHCLADFGLGISFTWNYKNGGTWNGAGVYVAQLAVGNGMIESRKILLP
ncbi:MAG TPA: hypothetical protein VLX68_17240 [Chitinivibrionales bacterium]|nr:hypothetical protein [Chitinivibrionales bacterium]